MAARGRPKAALVLSDAERETLTRWSHQPKASLALRANIVLACADGGDNTEVAAQLGVWPQTVGRWRARFVRDRLDGLCDEPRPGAPRKITDEQVEAVIAKTLAEAPVSGDRRWSTRSMARATGMSQTAISRIWRTFGLKPHLVPSWQPSTDPQFLDVVRGIAGLYIDPPQAAVVLAADKKSQTPAQDHTTPVPPMPSAAASRRTHDIHNGTTSPFAALHVVTATAAGPQQLRRHQREFLRFLKTIDANTPADLDLRLICDNDATNKTQAVRNWLVAHPRFHVHVTPTYASWLDLVQRWFDDLTNRTLRRSTHRSLTDLDADVTAWAAAWHEDGRPFVWTMTPARLSPTRRPPHQTSSHGQRLRTLVSE